jgi:hypothetical protein
MAGHTRWSQIRHKADSADPPTVADRFAIVERYRLWDDPHFVDTVAPTWVDRILFRWGSRDIANAATVEEARALRDELESERPEIAPLGIRDTTLAYTDSDGVTYDEWIDGYPWHGRPLWRRLARR